MSNSFTLGIHKCAYAAVVLTGGLAAILGSRVFGEPPQNVINL